MPDISETLAERGSRYGDFSNHAEIAQQLQERMRSREGWCLLTNDKKQALTVIADKIARILTGDPEYRDNWHDIQGYAKLAEDRCKDSQIALLQAKIYAEARRKGAQIGTPGQAAAEGLKGTDNFVEEASRGLGIEKDVDL